MESGQQPLWSRLEKILEEVKCRERERGSKTLNKEGCSLEFSLEGNAEGYG